MKKRVLTSLYALLALLIILFTIPHTRHASLNLLGFRGTLEISVIDLDSDQPLKNVLVVAGEQQALTDTSGAAVLSGVRLGSQEIRLSKVAYADQQLKKTVGLGTTSMDDAKLEPVGDQYRFKLVSWLSSTPIEGAEVEFGPSSAFSNSGGEALLTIPPTDMDFTASIYKSGYKVTEVKVPAGSKEVIQTPLVIDAKHYFSRSDYKIFRSDVDGDNAKLLLDGRGDNDSQIVPVYAQQAALILSSHEKKKDENDNALIGLYKFDMRKETIEKLDESTKLRIYGVSSGQLIYLKASGTNEQVLALDLDLGSEQILAEASAINDVSLGFGVVFIATKDSLIRADLSSAKTRVAFPAEVWTLYRTGINELTFNRAQDWYRLEHQDGAKPEALVGKPKNIATKLYQLSPDGSQAAFVDYSSGRGQLTLVELETGEEEIVYSASDLSDPIYWMDDHHISFRRSQVAADYVIDIRGGKPAKITDVETVAGYERWYYY